MKRLCVVAGVGPGIGAAVARQFATAGFDVALLARDAARLQQHVQAVLAVQAAPGVAVSAWPLDLGQPAEVRRVLGALQAAQGPVDVLVYNAARWVSTRAVDIAPEAFAAELAVSVTGALACVQAVHAGMRARGHGTVLITGGGLALDPRRAAGTSPLAAGKSALRALAHALHDELAAEGIGVTTVTVDGTVAAGTPLDPGRIAQLFLQLALTGDSGRLPPEVVIGSEKSSWPVETGAPGVSSP